MRIGCPPRQFCDEAIASIQRDRIGEQGCLAADCVIESTHPRRLPEWFCGVKLAAGARLWPWCKCLEVGFHCGFGAESESKNENKSFRRYCVG